MNTIPDTRDISFLKGGGEMGNLTRNFDWSNTSVGPHEKWPYSLRTTVSNLLLSKFPMFLWWGEEMVQFYNDAYRPSMGIDGKHPSALGGKGQDFWPEIWPTVYPLLQQVRDTGEAMWRKDMLVPISRNGRIEDVYWTFSYSLVLNDDGEYGGILVTCMETTQSVESQKRLEENQARLKAIFEQAPIAIGLLEGRDMIIKEGNDLIFELWGKPRSVTGMKLMEALPELKDQPFLGILQEVYDTGKPFFGNGILAKLHRNGLLQDVYFDFAYTAIKDTNGTVTSVLVVATEVTDRVLSKIAIEISENKLQAIISAAPVALAVFMHRDLIIENPNQAFIEIVGKGPEIKGLPLHVAMPELISEGQPFLKILDEVFATGVPFISEAALVKIEKNGVIKDKFFNISYIPLFNNVGEVYGILDVAIDVTEQVLAQQRLAESEARFRSIADQSPIIIFIIEPNENATISYWSRSWLEYTGQSLEQALGRAWDGIVHKDDLQAVLDIYLPAFKNRQPYTIPAIRLKRHDGIYRWHHFKASPQYLPNGDFMGYVGVSIDIHLQKTTLEQLELKNYELVRSNNELDSFIYTASHDLKAPISNLEGLMNEYFDDVEINDEQQQIVDMMFHSIDRFKNTIKDLTEISKIQHQKGDKDFETLLFDEILEEIKLDIRELLIKFSPKIETEFAINAIRYSRKDLRSIMYNLVSNALKYSSPDRLPEVKISTIEQDNSIVLKVSDNGLGLSNQDQSKLFRMFKRVHQHVEGSGIGLYMIKKMIENAGGRIEIESEVGIGTTFIVYFNK